MNFDLDSGKYSDLTLYCHEKTWKVHCVIVCTSSSVMKAAVDGNFAEGQNHEINFPDDEPKIVEKMLRFLYQGDYDDERDMDATSREDFEPIAPGNSSLTPSTFTPSPRIETRVKPNWSEESLLFNVQVYIIADKNDITALKKRATEKYEELLERLWDTRSFPVSAKLLYDNTPESDRLLRDVVAEIATKNIRTLIDKGDFVEVMMSYGDLAVDILKSVVPRAEEVDPSHAFRTGWKKKKGGFNQGISGELRCNSCGNTSQY